MAADVGRIGAVRLFQVPAGNAAPVVLHLAPQLAALAPQPQPSLAPGVAHGVGGDLVHREDEVRQHEVGEPVCGAVPGQLAAHGGQRRPVELALQGSICRDSRRWRIL